MNATVSGYWNPHQLELSEALQEIERRESFHLANIEASLRELRAAGVKLADQVDAATVRRLEVAGMYLDFDTGKVGRCL